MPVPGEAVTGSAKGGSRCAQPLAQVHSYSEDVNSGVQHVKGRAGAGCNDSDRCARMQESASVAWHPLRAILLLYVQQAMLPDTRSRSQVPPKAPGSRSMHPGVDSTVSTHTQLHATASVERSRWNGFAGQLGPIASLAAALHRAPNPLALVALVQTSIARDTHMGAAPVPDRTAAAATSSSTDVTYRQVCREPGSSRIPGWTLINMEFVCSTRMRQTYPWSWA